MTSSPRAYRVQRYHQQVLFIRPIIMAFLPFCSVLAQCQPVITKRRLPPWIQIVLSHCTFMASALLYTRCEHNAPTSPGPIGLEIVTTSLGYI